MKPRIHWMIEVSSPADRTYHGPFTNAADATRTADAWFRRNPYLRVRVWRIDPPTFGAMTAQHQ